MTSSLYTNLTLPSKYRTPFLSILKFKITDPHITDPHIQISCRNVQCCAFRAGGSTTSYRIRVRAEGCRAYKSFVNLDYGMPANRWPAPGVELQWLSPPEPTCSVQADCGSGSTCGADRRSNPVVSRCFCNSGLRWDPVGGVCASETKR